MACNARGVIEAMNARFIGRSELRGVIKVLLCPAAAHLVLLLGPVLIRVQQQVYHDSSCPMLLHRGDV